MNPCAVAQHSNKKYHLGQIQGAHLFLNGILLSPGFLSSFTKNGLIWRWVKYFSLADRATRHQLAIKTRSFLRCFQTFNCGKGR
jgi:hypothetical protein